MKQMVLRLKHGFIVIIYILNPFGEQSSLSVHETESTDRSKYCYLLTETCIPRTSHLPKPSLGHRMPNTNGESRVVHNTTAECIHYLLNSKIISRYDKELVEPINLKNSRIP